MTNNKIQRIENYVKKLMANEAAHDFKHVARVRNWALRIARNEKFLDFEIVEIAALLHDIGLAQSGPRRKHGEVGARMAAVFLEENKLLIPEKIDEVCNAIRCHNKNREGEGRLLDILRDSDMMDLFGAVGIMRAFISKLSIAEYNPENIKGETWQMKAKDFDKRFDSGIGIGKFITDQINFQISCYDNLATKTAKKSAKPLIKYMIDFMEQLEAEIGGGSLDTNESKEFF